jgi:hypothetical protein
MQFGSVINEVMAEAKSTPKVGDGATILSWSDRHAGTVIAIEKTGEIKVQQDTAKVVSGSPHDGSAVYEYERNPEGTVLTFKAVSRGKDKGKIRENGRKDGRSVIFGRREEYFDPHF